ncbi:MAG: TetR/AcrR family transcriptional regulator [Qingshengfaniella sp.]
MNAQEKEKRHKAIADAAYELLTRYGYAATSMLRIAKQARASNETLYRWYGNKDGLIQAMVEDNALAARKMLTAALDTDDDPRAALEQIAPVFLGMVLGDRAVLLNQAAAADPTGRLGAAVSAGGRAQVMPLMEQLMARILASADHPADHTPPSPGDCAAWFVSLLVGDLQVRRIIHDAPCPDPATIDRHCTATLHLFYRLIDTPRDQQSGRPPQPGR